MALEIQCPIQQFCPLIQLLLDNDTVIPEGIIPRKFTMMVWDNIDFLEETPTGAGSTHTANGIIIQQTRDDQQLPKHRQTSTTL